MTDARSFCMALRPAENQVQTMAEKIYAAMQSSGGEKGLYATEAASLGFSFPEPNHSPYGRDGQRVPYQLIFVRNATGPHLQLPDSPAPAVIYMAVSSDRKHFRVTATALDAMHENRVDFVREDGTPWVK